MKSSQSDALGRMTACPQCGKPLAYPTGMGGHRRYCKVTDEQLFWAKVQKGKDCWIWLGAVTKDGYGKIGIRGEYIYTHRFSYELAFGSIPAGMHILHSCDTPRCVNPMHLRIGTQIDNMKDAYQKRRHAFGERCPRRKLSEEQAIEILGLRGKAEAKDLAERFKVGPGAIHAIWKRRYWKHIEETANE